MNRLGSVLLFLPLLASAQSTSATGTLQGTVTDPTGAAVPAAKISARNEDTRATRNTATDAAGQFTLRSLPIGSYTMTVQADGFATVQVKPFLLSVGQVVVQRFELRPAGITERIEVKEHPDAIDVAASTASVVIGYERIEEAPSRSPQLSQLCSRRACRITRRRIEFPEIHDRHT